MKIEFIKFTIIQESDVEVMTILLRFYIGIWDKLKSCKQLLKVSHILANAKLTLAI